MNVENMSDSYKAVYFPHIDCEVEVTHRSMGSIRRSDITGPNVGRITVTRCLEDGLNSRLIQSTKTYFIPALTTLSTCLECGDVRHSGRDDTGVKGAR